MSETSRAAPHVRVRSTLVGSVAAVCFAAATYAAMSAGGADVAVTVPGQRVVSPFLREIAPQGWAFFTKDAQSEYVVPYRIDDDRRLARLTSGSGSNARWAFGWNREGRAQGVEIASLLTNVPRAHWTVCNASDRCAPKTSTRPDRVQNATSEPTLCGSLQLRAFQPIPWAWRSLTTEPELIETISLDVRCR